ncbi:helix-turn-helix domain-containing protein [Kineococcus sp. SYSU DK001]|uniref:helix-turn-helix domain-containing protein n=1 Tax=Kineococcus sp. SYSU DK001 TaxID=3383122 RepID=UPI003D7CFA94
MDEQELTAVLDDLLCRGASLEEVLRATARAVGGSAGWSGDGCGAAYDAAGAAVPARPPSGSRARALAHRDGGTVWVHAAPGTAAEFPATALDRLVVAATVTLRWRGFDGERRPVLEVLLDPDAAPAERDEALARAGVEPSTAVRVVLCGGPEAALATFLDGLSRQHRVLALDEQPGRRTILLAAGDRRPDPPAVPVCVKAVHSGPYPAEQVLAAHRNALDTYRFARPSTQESGPHPLFSGVWLDGEELRTIGLLTRIGVEEIGLLPDVRALQRLRETSGELVLRVLEAYAASASMRTAAEMVHLHHNSVRYWIHKVEGELGYSLTEPYARAQLFITLCLHRLWAQRDDADR